MPQVPDDLRHHPRLELRRKLGAGASGTVYEAWDAERGAAVAVKVLRQLGPADLYRFKNEFRTLADVSHPNLVQLYELRSDGERWSFTMELIDGVDFRTWVRGERGPDELDTAAGSQPTWRETPRITAKPGDIAPPREAPLGLARGGNDAPPATTDPGPTSPTPDPDRPSGFDEDRLRAAMVQLAQGLAALHANGKLHRDLKPTNVLVETSGRVVLLDFGLIRDAEPQQTYQSLHEGIVGTPAYMAPEQAAGLDVGPPSDWYAVGAMLYEALTGRPPFVGSGLQVLIEKQSKEPPPPHLWMGSREAAERARDLQELALELLARDPSRRPSGRAVLRRLGAAPSARGPFSSHSTSWPSSSRFVGRAAALDTLRRAYDDAQRGQVTLLVEGPPGAGKSALARRFLEGLRELAEPPVVLSGRCYLNESLPYKAVDSLMDALSRYLRGLPPAEAQGLVPADVQALARLFPVLGRVEAISAAERRVLDVPDSLELRRRAFGALREMLARLATQRPLVLSIDDLQWGDADSAALLAELARPPHAPPLLLLGCLRSGADAGSPLVDSLRKVAATTGGIDLRELPLPPLTLAESETLARHALTERPVDPPSGEATTAFRVGYERDGSPASIITSEPIDAALATVLARASGGNPFFLHVLVRYAQALATDAPGDGLAKRISFPSLEALVGALLGRLPDDARALAEVVAVAAHPLAVATAAKAAGLDATALQTALTVLRAGKLVLVRETAGNRTVEPYLNQIAEAAAAVLPEPRRRELHGRIAAALLLDPQVDPEALALHFRAGGEAERAAEYALRAARRARETLAFDREAELLRLVLELPGLADTDRRALTIELGEAASNAGRGAEAAAAYLAAAPGAKAGVAVELRRRAAEQLLISGRIDEGVAAIEEVLAAIGMRLPKTPRAAFRSLLWRRLLLRLRGLSFRERDSTQIPAERLIAIDTCWSVTVGLGLVDTIRGLDFGTRGLLLALAAGEPSRVARALALEIGVSGAGGTRSEQHTEAIVAQAMRLAKKLGDPQIEGLATMVSGMGAYMRGAFALARERLERGEWILRERCRGVTWELDTATTMLFRVLSYLGDWEELNRRLPAALEGFAARGDLYAETNVRSRIAWTAWLMRDQPAAARAEATAAIARWSHRSFHLQHYWQLTGLAEIALYEERGQEAWELVASRWPELEKSSLLRIQFTRLEATHLRLRTALAAIAEAGLDSPLYRQLAPRLRRELDHYERSGAAWVDPLAALVRAGLAALEGQREAAVAGLERAIAGAERHHLALYHAVARIRLGQLHGDPGRARAGQEVTAQATAAARFLREQGVVRPDRWCDVLAPGGW